MFIFLKQTINLFSFKINFINDQGRMSINPFALPQNSIPTTSYLYPTTENMFQQTEYPINYSTTSQNVRFNALSPPPSYNQIANNNENEEAIKELNQKS